MIGEEDRRVGDTGVGVVIFIAGFVEQRMASGIGDLRCRRARAEDQMRQARGGSRQRWNNRNIARRGDAQCSQASMPIRPAARFLQIGEIPRAVSLHMHAAALLGGHVGTRVGILGCHEWHIGIVAVDEEAVRIGWIAFDIVSSDRMSAAAVGDRDDRRDSTGLSLEVTSPREQGRQPAAPPSRRVQADAGDIIKQILRAELLEMIDVNQMR